MALTVNANGSYQYDALDMHAFNVRDFDAFGNGTDQTIQVQNALNAAGEVGGGLVYAGPGLYIYSSDLVVPSNVHFQGSGKGTIFQAAPGCQANGFKLSGVSHVTISDLQIDGNKLQVAQLATQYTKLQGIYITGGSDDITIERCYIHDCYVSGIMADSSTNLIISNNRLLNCGDNQVYVRAKSVSPYTPCSNVTITGNISSGSAFSGIQVLGSSYGAITGNTCYGNGPSAGQGNGIGCEGASHVTITGNVSHDNGVQGINIRYTSEVGSNQASSHITVVGNTIYNHPSTGGDAGGIGVSDSNHVLLANNLLYNNNFGINVANVANLGTSDLKISGNSIKTSSDTGIRLNPTAGVTYEIDNNYVTDTTNNGIALSRKAWVHDNVIPRSAGNGAIACSTGSGGSVLEGNRCYDGANNGIQIDNGVANVILRHNYHANVEVGTQGRGVQEVSGAGPTLLEDETFSNITFQPFNLTNASSVSRRSKLINGSAAGFLDANSGNASISAATSIVVTHGLWKTPTRVEITPTGDPGAGIRYWVSAKGATTFTITLSASSTVTFDWRAWTWDG